MRIRLPDGEALLVVNPTPPEKQNIIIRGGGNFATSMFVWVDEVEEFLQTALKESKATKH